MCTQEPNCQCSAGWQPAAAASLPRSPRRRASATISQPCAPHPLWSRNRPPCGALVAGPARRCTPGSAGAGRGRGRPRRSGARSWGGWSEVGVGGGGASWAQFPQLSCFVLPARQVQRGGLIRSAACRDRSRHCRRSRRSSRSRSSGGGGGKSRSGGCCSSPQRRQLQGQELDGAAVGAFLAANRLDGPACGRSGDEGRNRALVRVRAWRHRMTRGGTASTVRSGAACVPQQLSSRSRGSSTLWTSPRCAQPSRPWLCALPAACKPQTLHPRTHQTCVRSGSPTEKTARHSACAPRQLAAGRQRGKAAAGARRATSGGLPAQQLHPAPAAAPPSSPNPLLPPVTRKTRPVRSGMRVGPPQVPL